MTTPTEAALLAQILAAVQAVAAEVSAVKITVATAVAEIEHRARQGEDHEARLRVVEAHQSASVTQADLDGVEERRRKEVADALELADKKANRRIYQIGLIMTAVVAVVNITIALL